MRKLLHQRRTEGSTPGTRSDPFKLGLAVEGGAMRAVISAAMLNALQDLGFVSVFDVVYGASGGSMNAAYFLAGEAWHALSLYYNDLMTKEFLDFRRPLRGQPALCLDFVLDDLMDRRIPLDWASLLSCDIPFKIVASSVRRLQATILSGFATKADLKLALKASSCIPYLAGPSVSIGDDAFYDAAWQQAHPYIAAVDDGCTHVLALSTQPAATDGWHRSLRRRLRARPDDNAVGTAGRNRHQRATAYVACKQLLGTATIHQRGTPFIMEVAPDGASPIPRPLERDVGRVLHGARSGYEAAVLAIEGRTARVLPRLTEAQDLIARRSD